MSMIIVIIIKFIPIFGDGKTEDTGLFRKNLDLIKMEIEPTGPISTASCLPLKAKASIYRQDTQEEVYFFSFKKKKFLICLQLRPFTEGASRSFFPMGRLSPVLRILSICFVKT